MRLFLAVVCLALVGIATVARGAPDCRLRGRPWLEAKVAGATTPLERAVDARLGETIEVFVVAPGFLDGRAVQFSEAPGRRHVSWRAAGCGPMAVAWRRIEPRMLHTTTRGPDPKTKLYANAVLFGPHHGKWIGFDRIEYFETPIPDQREPRLQVRDARPSAATGLRRPPPRDRLGTLRLAATVSAGGVTLSTPGLDAAPDGQIGPSVLRYSFRSGDDFLGWLSSFYNVPYLFGSAGRGARSQAERYVGADCADILVAALRRSGLHHLEYSSVGELVDALPQVAGPSVMNGAPAEPAIAIGGSRGARPGDLIALDYIGVDELPGAWDHIVALVEDRGPDGKPDGQLGPDDLVADSGSSDGLTLAPLGGQGEVRLEVLRPQ